MARANHHVFQNSGLVRWQLGPRLAIIHGELHRLYRIVVRFLKLAGPSELELAPVAVGQIVTHVCDLLRPEAATRQVEILAEVESNLPVIVADFVRLAVYDEDGTPIGEYFADLFVDNRLIVELKAPKAIADQPTAQLLGYFRASHVEHGLLLNFGAPKFEIKKYARSQRPDGSGLGSVVRSFLAFFAPFALFRG